jgi:hypothetical protein
MSSLVVLAASFLPWFQLSLSDTSAARSTVALTRQVGIYDPAYSGWHLAIPVACVVTIIIGLMNALLRPAQRGAVFVFALLRISGLLLLLVVLVTLFVKEPHGLGLTSSVTVSVRLLWPAYAAAIAAFVGLLSSFAKSGH